jgi:hypothetical protein
VKDWGAEAGELGAEFPGEIVARAFDWGKNPDVDYRTLGPGAAEFGRRVRMSGASEYLRTQAVSRLMLDNIYSIGSSWVTMGPHIGQVALFYGANDMGSVMMEENVVSSAGTTYCLDEAVLCRLIREAGFLPAQRGLIKTLDERTVGEHPGVIYYTLGQREGLGIGGVKGAVEGPWFVVRKDVPNNVLYVTQGHDHPALLSQRLSAEQVHWIAGAPPPLPYRCSAKTRYRQSDQPCTVLSHDEGRVEVTFDQPQRAVTPGQSVVFYQGEVCLGGGIIDQTA